MLRAARRRFSPDWSLPREVFLFMVAPTWLALPSSLPISVGSTWFPVILDHAKLQKWAASHWRLTCCKDSAILAGRARMRNIHAHARSSAVLPGQANLSQVFLLDKGKKNSGCQIMRWIHTFCSWCRVFYKKLWRVEAYPFSWPSWAFGGVTGRRREEFMLATRVASFLENPTT